MNEPVVMCKNLMDKLQELMELKSTKMYGEINYIYMYSYLHNFLEENLCDLALTEQQFNKFARAINSIENGLIND